jgi:hypothetical protein
MQNHPYVRAYIILTAEDTDKLPDLGPVSIKTTNDLLASVIGNKKGFVIERLDVKWQDDTKSSQFDDAKLPQLDLCVLMNNSKLANLTVLNLPDCPMLSDTLIPKIAGLKQLQKLNLSGGSGVTENGWKPLLASYSNLVDLNLSRTNIGDDVMPFIAGLTHLRKLNLSSCKFTRDAWELFNPPLCLEDLTLAHTNIGKMVIPNLGQLKRLNNLRSVNLTACYDLWLGGARATLQALAGLPLLQKLYFNFNGECDLYIPKWNESDSHLPDILFPELLELHMCNYPDDCDALGHYGINNGNRILSPKLQVLRQHNSARQNGTIGKWLVTLRSLRVLDLTGCGRMDSNNWMATWETWKRENFFFRDTSVWPNLIEVVMDDCRMINVDFGRMISRSPKLRTVELYNCDKIEYQEWLPNNYAEFVGFDNVIPNPPSIWPNAEYIKLPDRAGRVESGKVLR